MKNSILLICATKPEWSVFKKRHGGEKQDGPVPFYKLAGFGSVDVSLAQVGIGPQRAQKSFAALLESINGTPSQVIHFGLSGGLIEELQTGDLIEVAEVVDVSGSVIHCKGGERARLFTSPSVLKTPQEKSAAFKKHEAIAVDMETYPIALMCQQHNIPYLSIRAIFDPLGWDLSTLEAADSMSAAGEVQLGSLAKKVITTPKLLMSLPRYQKTAQLCGENLYEWVAQQVTL